MSDSSHITLAAFVTESERAPVQAAAGFLARALSEASGATSNCACVFAPDFAALKSETRASIFVISLVPELDRLDQPWPVVEQRLRAAYADLAGRDLPVFVATILRHVGPEIEPEMADALRIRIRRLNLLAAEISRESGTFVIDLDRALADIGARKLRTDFRHSGSAAVDLIGHAIALTLVNDGLESVAPFEVQDAARRLLASSRPAIGGSVAAPGEMTLKVDILALGDGRRKQKVRPTAFSEDNNYAGWLVRQVLRGAIGPGEALRRIYAAMNRRGLRGTFSMLVTGLSRQLDRKN